MKSKIFSYLSLTLYHIIPKIYSKIVGIAASSVTSSSILLSSRFSKQFNNSTRTESLNFHQHQRQ